ncbi:MAG: RNA polymerase factor sigma-54 [Nitrospinota bacterium]|nr:RNA polymerase factor sigma-54 [Nitrospinota bacterium]MDH5677041.1 RNA polymerase factor sigma-54 [Nitrospinota bacterium]MDH5755064.1 RNA polymerase factor sigma-54 [Nitrospinota bacterium]
MGIELKLQMRQAQRLVMTPMLQQAIKLLPMTRLELIQAIRNELEQNPLLEEEGEEALETTGSEAAEAPNQEEESIQPQEKVFEEQTTLEDGKSPEKKDDVDWDTYMQNDLYEGRTGDGNTEFPSIENTLRQKESLEAHLMWQLGASALDEEEERLGELIIGNINMEGYLVESLEELAKEAEVDVEAIEDALILVQSFDPPGVGARDLKECLLLQAHSAKLKGTVVEKLIQSHLEELDERNYKKIAKSMDVTQEDIIDAVRIIKEFDPKPGLEYNPEEAVYITPDLYVVKVDNEYQVYLNDEDIPRLRINSYYQSILKNKSKDTTQTREYVEEKFRGALWMIKSIEQRRQTMLKVGRSLCKFQREFMDNGLEFLKPLVLKDVAEDIGMHESTISRVTTNKYIHTPQGLFELKFFFHSAVGSFVGSDMSSVRVKEMIRIICKEEDASKPYTDDQIAAILKEKNVRIARRTVTKYRKELKIPSTSKRKKLFL